MQDKEIYIYDIDGTLIDMDVKAWVIDKNEPSKPILKLDPLELFMIQKGAFKRDELVINYNDEKYYINKELFEKIKKKKLITIENLGISFIEYIDDKIFNKVKIDYLIDNIRHLADVIDRIIILTGRYDRKAFSQILNNLRLQLTDLGIEIWKMHFVGDHTYNTSSDKIAIEKVKILLEYLIGLQIKDDKFVPLRQDQFDVIHFYDDDFKNIDYAEDIQKYFEQVLKNTKDDEVYKFVMKRIDNKLTLNLNLITSNELNKFKTTIVNLETPKKYPIKISEKKHILGFNSFKNPG